MCRIQRLIVWAWPIVVTPCAHADSITIPAGRDNTVFSESTNSGGLATTFIAGRNNAGGVRRALLWFDVAGQVPAASVITGVTLTAHLDSAAQTETQARDLGLYRLSADWGEGTSGGGGPGGGQGQAATPGDATWLHRYFDTQFWTNPGGDFAATASGSASVGVAPGFYAWSSTAGLVADVQDWLNNPATNFGWALTADESINGTVRRFQSREAADPATRPLLAIDYHPVPEPTGGASLLLGGLLCVVTPRCRRAQ
jgi:hypothetical protein